jgi:hypothetical protein
MRAECVKLAVSPSLSLSTSLLLPRNAKPLAPSDIHIPRCIHHYFIMNFKWLEMMFFISQFPHDASYRRLCACLCASLRECASARACVPYLPLTEKLETLVSARALL